MRIIKIQILLLSIIGLGSLIHLGCKTSALNLIKRDKKLDNDSYSLPTYVKYNLDNPKEPKILRTAANKLKFPLTPQDKNDIDILVKKYERESNIAGLAAPQIKIQKKIIVFSVIANDKLKKWRPDLTDEMPKTIWINPKYEPASDEKHEDYEGCFSVDNFAGKVSRYKSINYEAYIENGEKVQGRVSGFLARVIQHEIDHVNGKCFPDLTPRNKWIRMEEYKKLREERTK